MPGIHYRATDLSSNRCLDRFGKRTEMQDLLCLCMSWVVGTAIPSLSKPNILGSEGEGTDWSTQLFLHKNTKHWAFNCMESFTIQIICRKDTYSPKIGRIWQDYLKRSCFHVQHLAVQGNIPYFRASQNSARALWSQWLTEVVQRKESNRDIWDYPEGNEAWQENTLFLSMLCFMQQLQCSSQPSSAPPFHWVPGAALLCLQPQPGLGSPALTRGRLGIQSPATDVSICISQPRGNNLLFGLFVCFSFSLLKIEIKDWKNFLAPHLEDRHGRQEKAPAHLFFLQRAILNTWLAWPKEESSHGRRKLLICFALQFLPVVP